MPTRRALHGLLTHCRRRLCRDDFAMIGTGWLSSLFLPCRSESAASSADDIRDAVRRPRRDPAARAARLFRRVPSRRSTCSRPSRARRGDRRRHRRPRRGAARPVPRRRADRRRREGAGRGRAGPRTFHLVERDFGRFARAVRLTGAFDVAARPRDAARRRADDRAAEAGRPPRPAAPHRGHRRVTDPPHEHPLHRRHRRPARPRDWCARGCAGWSTHHDVDLVIANAENSATGFGITRDIGDTLLDWGVDVMTSGNHIWDKKEAIDYIATEPRLLRPANYPAGVPGRGSYVAQTGDGRAVGVINVMGRVFMLNIDDPFAVVLKEIEAMRAPHQGHHRRLPRRGDQREGGDGLASRRQGHRWSSARTRTCRPPTSASCPTARPI